MTFVLASAAMPLARRIDPERAHRLAVTALRLGLGGSDPEPDDPVLAVTALGRRFRNPIGLAAGFDKDAVAVRGLRRIGFGAIEAGTVTPRPQPGNPRPRLFRLPEDGAVINRMGFNNQGLASFVRRLAALSRGPVATGANVGVNKDSTEPERDYAAAVAAVVPHADYIVINVSSPNTPGLRDLQAAARLHAVLDAVRAAAPVRPPLLVKVAPDLSDAGLEAVVEVAVSAGLDGLVVSNTTLARPASLRSAHRGEAGGLSGAPLFAPSTDMLRRASRLAQRRLVLIGVGGVASGQDALAKIKAGAHLVQIYTAFVLQGPAVVPRIKRELAAGLRADGFSSLAEAVGVAT